MEPSLELPLGVLPPGDEPLDARRLARWTWTLVLLGLAARVVRYLLVFPLWDDEAFLNVNLLDRGYAGLLEPLAHHQVAPVLFLWTQLSVVKLLGFTEQTLRLIPFLCSVGGLLLFWHVATLALRGTARLLAVGIFAVGYPLVRYSCEAKPYGCDMFVSLVLFALAIHWWRNRRRAWLVALTAVVPVALLFSYPAVFTAGGISLAVALVLWREGKGESLIFANAKIGTVPGWSDWAWWAAYCAAMVGGFALVYFLSTGPQSAAELAWMRDYWKEIFPPLGNPWGMVKWLVVIHTGELLQYPVGGSRGASTLTTIACAVALVFLCRRRQYAVVAFCVAPALPNMIAALMWRYPYGGSVRFVLYLAPMVCLLAGLGAAVALVRRDASGKVRSRPAVVTLSALLAIVAAGSILRDFLHPYRTAYVRGERDFARWFWPVAEDDAEVVFWDLDVPEGADSPVCSAAGAALYRCNRQIYSPRLARGESAQWDRLSAARPLACVRWTTSTTPGDDAAFARWLDAMQARYKLIAHNRYRIPMRHKNPKLDFVNTVDAYEFAPKAAGASGEAVPLDADAP
ncbi:MAG: glycosyltransferase family 39 protein [Pirellulales bacterium]|nr:glycosyltransferase family 39 protein [Pirellulales bacterium]